MTIDRLTLWHLVGQRHDAEATMTRAYRDVMRYDPMALVKDVLVNDSIEVDHLGIPMPETWRRRIPPGTRFRFNGMVIDYERENGTQSVSFRDIRLAR